jgi:hypothetical protein
MGLLQVLFDKLIWYAIGAKRSPASILPGMLLELLLDLTLSKSKLKIAVHTSNCMYRAKYYRNCHDRPKYMIASDCI